MARVDGAGIGPGISGRNAPEGQPEEVKAGENMAKAAAAAGAGRQQRNELGYAGNAWGGDRDLFFFLRHGAFLFIAGESDYEINKLSNAGAMIYMPLE